MAHPYAFFSPSSSSGGTIVPDTIAGLVVWNRGDTLAGANGSTVTTWANVGNASGPTISCSGTQSNAVLNGSNVVNFTTAQSWTSSTDLVQTSYTFIQVSRQTPSTYGRVFQSYVNGTNQLHGYWSGSNQVYWVEANPAFLTGCQSAQTVNNWAIISEARVVGGAYEFRWNTARIYKGTSSTASNLEGLAINAYAGGAREQSTCQIAEVILYNSVLPKYQIVGVENYLKQKWGL